MIGMTLLVILLIIFIIILYSERYVIEQEKNKAHAELEFLRPQNARLEREYAALLATTLDHRGVKPLPGIGTPPAR